MAEHIDTGKQGEEMAVEFLQNKGMKILETNWRSGKYEIDIIAREGNTLVIAEVKTRQGKPLVDPEVAVDKAKQKLLIRAANSYVLRHHLDIETRFDIITVILNPGKPQIHHIPDAFYPTLR